MVITSNKHSQTTRETHIQTFHNPYAHVSQAKVKQVRKLEASSGVRTSIFSTKPLLSLQIFSSQLLVKVYRKRKANRQRWRRRRLGTSREWRAWKICLSSKTVLLPVVLRRFATQGGFRPKDPAPSPFSSPLLALSLGECIRSARATRSVGKSSFQIFVYQLIEYSDWN